MTSDSNINIYRRIHIFTGSLMSFTELRKVESLAEYKMNLILELKSDSVPTLTRSLCSVH